MTRAPQEGFIRIRGARQNNLAEVDVDLPRDALVAITGVSGSGKSSLAFDTLYREGQRRFLETLSAYARQFLGGLSKPDVDSIEGLSPAIAVDQNSIPRGTRSTVGTLTEITDHLRVLFARAGVAHSPWCGKPVESRTPESVVQELIREYSGARVQIAAPQVRDRKGQHRALLDSLRRKGFVRVRVDGEIMRIEEVPELARYKRHSIEVVVDRIKPSADDPARLRESVDSALELGEGELLVITRDGAVRVAVRAVCPETGRELPPLEPRLFSFNSPHGACPRCDGLGVLRTPTEAAVVRDATLSVREGALAVTRASGGALNFPRVDFRFLELVADRHGFDLDTPWSELTSAARKVLLRGSGSQRYQAQGSWNGKRVQGEWTWRRTFRGVLTELERAWARGSRRKQIERFLSMADCPECSGGRLNEAARNVLLGGTSLPQLCALPILELTPALQALDLTARQERIARDLLSEVRRRSEFLERVGLGYLTLERGADSLSGGEAQRIRLAAQLGAGLSGVLYVLDEPSIGLHARDQQALLGALRHLVQAGNSVVVVEHDEATLRSADWIVDVGPGAGRDGGRICAQGRPRDVARADTPTGRLLRGELRLPAPAERRPGNGAFIQLRGARAFNLQALDVDLPLGTLTVVTGVSGSGKSTLIQRTLRPLIERHLGREGQAPGELDAADGLEAVDDLVVVDAAPIGRTTRSNPATYTKLFGPIRDLFAALPEARMRGYDKSRFSFNVEGGRCGACVGAGAQLVELQFLAPVTVPCAECGGGRFQQETLDVRYRDHSISDVLALTAREALELFADHPRIAQPLQLMCDIGLGYLTLGQPSTTLSGGEAQRIKLVTHLQKRPRGHTVYLLDEPTTGLHMEDVERLVGALQRLVDGGHTVVVIEHNLDLVWAADHVIDLGPGAGAEGGRLMAAGTPEEIRAQPRSHTGVALAELNSARGRWKPARRARRRSALDTLRVTGARTHNLRSVDVKLPKRSLCVITGPSGSGKSSLALDTIHTEGRRRFVESLSTYARQFLGTQARPPFEHIEGLGPSIAVEAGQAGSHPRSTIATTTELLDHARVLWARAGTLRCPTHGQALRPADPGALTRRILKDVTGTRRSAAAFVLAPIWGAGTRAGSREDLERLVTGWRSEGYLRCMWAGVEQRLDQQLPEGTPGTLDLVVDRLAMRTERRARVAEAVSQAAALAGGRVSIQFKDGRRSEYSTHGACAECGFHVAESLAPRHFSFNTHAGACPACDGLGASARCAPQVLITRPQRSIVDGAIPGKLGRYLTKGKGYYETLLRRVARSHRVDLERPFERLTQRQQDLIARGVGARAEYAVTMVKTTRNTEMTERFTATWNGLCGHVDAWHRKAEDPEWAALLEAVMVREQCPSCQGERLGPVARSVTLGGTRLPTFLAMDVSRARGWVARLKLPAARRDVLQPVLAEISSRLGMLERVGLGYLTLDRTTSTISGGEARRVRLSASLGSELVGVCYVLDEPTVGLHPADIARLTDALCDLRDRGNSVLVVEHDSQLMARADWIVDLGPGAGAQGGRMIASGPPREVARHPTSSTAAYLRGDLDSLDPGADQAGAAVPGRPQVQGASTPADHDARELEPAARRAGPVLRGARLHNLRGVGLQFDFGAVTGICGPSGSGKSTLILDVLVPALQGQQPGGRWRSFRCPDPAPRTMVVDSAPLGRTPHSTPATYTGLMTPLRELFARTPEARMRAYGPANFSFNSTRGRCPACDGKGAVLVEMQFLADLWLTCDECSGLRYRPEVLEVRFRGRSIADVLQLTVDETREFFAHQPRLIAILDTLAAVGLGYLPLGQSSTTLSGGEAQRVKLASELARARGEQPSVIVLDEPSTGLSAADTVHLVRALRSLARQGDAVVLIEHDEKLLNSCDHLIELGPGGGAEGGKIVTMGSPQQLASDPHSVTGPWLSLGAPFPSAVRSRKRAAARKNTPAGKADS